MKAARIHRFGPPDAIGVEDIPDPAPGQQEVLVRVSAAGVGPWDAWVRAGKSVLPQPLPLTLGADFSGVVESIGAGVSEFRPGDEVFGVVNARFTGAYAEYAAVSAAMMALKPRKLAHAEAASLPVVAVTAWQMLFDHAALEVGQTVLVHGGAGGVGAIAVQLAHRLGARVIATDLGRSLDLVRRLGADEAIDARTTRFEDVVGKVDAVIDTIGGEVQQRSLAVLKRGGVLVSSVAPPDAREAESRGVRAMFMLVDVTTARLAAIAERVDASELVARVGVTMPLSEAVRAHEMLDGLCPRPSGKIVLAMGDAG